jgi:hypothetical protein
MTLAERLDCPIELFILELTCEFDKLDELLAELICELD